MYSQCAHQPQDRLRVRISTCIPATEPRYSAMFWYLHRHSPSESPPRQWMMQPGGGVAMAERVIGCPREEGIDYPAGEVCPECLLWKSRDGNIARRDHAERVDWTGRLEIEGKCGSIRTDAGPVIERPRHTDSSWQASMKVFSNAKLQVLGPVEAIGDVARSVPRSWFREIHD